MSKDAAEELTRAPSFSQWAFFQQEADGTIGRVCRWIHADKIDGEACWPHRAKTVDHLINHLRAEHDREEDRTVPRESDLRDTFTAYLRAREKGVSVPKRRGGMPTPPAEKRPRHRGYLISPTTIQQIKELSVVGEVPQGVVVEKLVAAEHARKFADRNVRRALQRATKRAEEEAAAKHRGAAS